MARFIDADALIDYLQYNLGLLGKPDVDKEPIAHGCYIVLEDMLVRILTTHTADVVEVRHGEWIDRDGKTWCSLCQASNKQYKPPYCPHCGAKMDEKVKNELFENFEQLVKTNDILVRGKQEYEVVIADDNIFVICPIVYSKTEQSKIVKYDKAEIYANQSSINTLEELKFTLLIGGGENA